MSPKKIKKLLDRKYRDEMGLFIVEGEKNIKELLASDFLVQRIIGTAHFLDSIHQEIQAYETRMNPHFTEVQEVEQKVIEETGTFVTNAAGIAVVKQKDTIDPSLYISHAKTNTVLVLATISDPGNLGTIIRVADWFGVTHIVASPSTVDFYNPKVINSSMGSFTHVTMLYTELGAFLALAHKAVLPVIGAVMDGENIHTRKLPRTGLLVMGSESHGITDDVLPFILERVTIPRFGRAESLNVGVATGIMLNELLKD